MIFMHYSFSGSTSHSLLIVIRAGGKVKTNLAGFCSRSAASFSIYIDKCDIFGVYYRKLELRKIKGRNFMPESLSFNELVFPDAETKRKKP